MFDKASRYHALGELTHRTPDGHEIIYKERRLVPLEPAVRETTLAQSERLDLVASRVYGNPLLFWRLCDANEELNPFELERVSGRALKLPSS